MSKNSQIFWHLHILACCSVGNQYSEVIRIFEIFKIKERVVRVNKIMITCEKGF